MSQAEEYEALVERVAIVIAENRANLDKGFQDCARAILAEVHRTISTVTERMELAWSDGGGGYNTDAKNDWSAMLAASPITPGEG